MSDNTDNKHKKRAHVMPSYKEQLMHPNWQRKRLEALQAANFKCEVCEADDKQLDAHHRRYVRGRSLWEYETSELQCLCRRCHTEAHDIKAMLEELVATCNGDDGRMYALGLTAGFFEANYSIEPHQFKRAEELSGFWLTESGIIASTFAGAKPDAQLKALLALTDGKPSGPVLGALVAELETRAAAYLVMLDTVGPVQHE